MEKTIQLLPRLSEKTYSLSNSRVYVVNVPRGINKLSVKKAMEVQFDVKVSSVNLTNIPGKVKRSISKNGRRSSKGRDNDVRKAYVTLREGHSLPFFEAIEEEEQQSAKIQEEMAKKIEKDEKPKRRSVRRAKTDEENK